MDEIKMVMNIEVIEGSLTARNCCCAFHCKNIFFEQSQKQDNCVQTIKRSKTICERQKLYSNEEHIGVSTREEEHQILAPSSDFGQGTPNVPGFYYNSSAGQTLYRVYIAYSMRSPWSVRFSVRPIYTFFGPSPHFSNRGYTYEKATLY
jgi:hypothetical protein